MTNDEYKQKRGILGIKRIKYSIRFSKFSIEGNIIKKEDKEEKNKNQDFDLKKHSERNQKLNNNRQKKVILKK